MKNLPRTLSVLLALLTVLYGCNDIELNQNKEKILGTWIDSDKSDTIHFVDHSKFFRSNDYIRYDRYDYELFKDSIEVRYSGRLYILVYPTLHRYSLNDDVLTIDFENRQCYGFSLTKMTYKKHD